MRRVDLLICMYRFAHISDIHLAPMPTVQARQLLNKRVLGYLSWHCKRKNLHLAQVVRALENDLKALKPDHICITGDLVNIALPGEIERARNWLGTLGLSEKISLIPGNHDVYVKSAQEKINRTWVPYMPPVFPDICQCGPIQIIGVSSAIATAPFMATGKAGVQQLRNLERILLQAGKNKEFRVVMIHHPPQSHATKWRKSLLDAHHFRDVIKRTGAEIILHGHLHHAVRTHLEGPQGPVPVFGAGSASLKQGGHYYFFTLEGQSLSAISRLYDEKSDSYQTGPEERLTIPLNIP